MVIIRAACARNGDAALNEGETKRMGYLKDRILEKKIRKHEKWEAETNGAGEAQILIFRPAGYADAREIARNLEQSRQVVIDFSGIEEDMRQKIADFMDGVAFAMHGQVHEITPQLLIAVSQFTDVETEEGENTGFGR